MAIKKADLTKLKEKAEELKTEGPLDEAQAEIWEELTKLTDEIDSKLTAYQDIFSLKDSTAARSSIRAFLGSLQYRKEFKSAARRTTSSISLSPEEFIALFEEKEGTIKEVAEELNLNPVTVSKYIKKHFVMTLREKEEE